MDEYSPTSPSLLMVEVVNALHRYVRHGMLLPEEASDALEAVLGLGIDLRSDAELHPRALALAGTQHLHGRKGSAMVHVGAVDAPVTVEVEAEDHSAAVTLADFVIPNDEVIPPEVRQKMAKWSDYVDCWAVDWDFRDDAFISGWTSYRTRRDRTLQLRSEPHAYPAAGTHRVLVKVIDIFGNDTSQAFDVRVG